MKTKLLISLLAFSVVVLMDSFGVNAQGTWMQKANYGGTGQAAPVGFSIGTKGYIGTGIDLNSDYCTKEFWEWDQATNVWTQKADFAGTARYAAVGFSIGTKGYVGAGINDDNTTYIFHDFWEWDQASNIWTKKVEFSGRERFAAAGFSIGTKGYIGSGMDSSFNRCDDFWEYNPSLDTWTKKADFPGGISVAVSFSIGTKGYIGTGVDSNTGSGSREFWEWDQVTDIWTQKADFGGAGRYWAAGFSLGTKGYIGTGTDTAEQVYNDFWEWNQSTNVWTQKTDFGGPARFATAGFSIGTKGYIGVGLDTNYLYINDFWEFDPAGNGISEIDLSNLISVYPNPSKGIFNLRSEIDAGEIFIYTLKGEKMYEGSLSSKEESIVPFHLEYAQGVYILRIKTKQGIATQKIIISR